MKTTRREGFRPVGGTLRIGRHVVTLSRGGLALAESALVAVFAALAATLANLDALAAAGDRAVWLVAAALLGTAVMLAALSRLLLGVASRKAGPPSHGVEYHLVQVYNRLLDESSLNPHGKGRA
ncbi:MAG TPA: hypothetical protein VF746_17655 [Longimicrobium sp.]